ncbi:FkbM family methyltransferase [Parageobacillus thermoglucosidasius]|uniref:FkbM family methyltransferase n=1 Tax=Parageobacillus thermoglucosidasius TaxID=1426 RepID=A0AB38QW60_PARTM|nr:FkbM family methyltransferase [Parageobacillus thermoglucosidasius]UOE76061.1 FkbM family methyltransferase [Parageobacillus thermoglucosidasius]GCD81156.1 hypothetical protein PTHTG4_02180 [Parageobacillus thermoglucosidasius]
MNLSISDLEKSVPFDSKINHLNQEIIIFGASEGGRIAKKYLEEKGKKIILFCDNDENKWGKFIDDIPIISPMELRNLRIKSFLIGIASKWYKEIMEQLDEMGLQNYFYIPVDIIKLDAERSYNVLNEIMDNKNKIEEVYSMLSDENSKKIFLNMLLHRITGDFNIIKTSEYRQYLHPLISSKKYKYIIDCGAFEGDTITLFFNFLAKSESLIYGFEPSPAVFRKLEKYIKKFYQNDNIIIEKMGVWSDNTELYFSNSNEKGADKIENNGNISIKVISLDKYFSSIPLYNPTFIKMDIEGAELQALKGSKRIISEYNPYLAICIYHDITHFWEVPLLIKEFNANYEFYVGHHSEFDVNETVLYAIPIEKK